MAIGDTAAAAGLPLVSGTVQANTIDTIENQTRDMVGQIMLNNPKKITVSPTAPASPNVGDVWIKQV
ncbi:hypothetical protein [Microbacterium invictum]|uniref:Uncharacterized protein n=1 Tax=Microbacterium invictum TaxID=515415 RepID=A0ABZ0VG91_9MICO|nr:hypothetical protein [Microbacterium invictum]WQB71958.1 hypothetical protein T9R20_08445 [Microbacterium invictum]